MSDEKLPLILHPGSSLALVRKQGGRIVAEMVSGALALSRDAEVSAKEKVYPKFKATCGFCGSPEGFKQTEEFYGCQNPKCKVRVFKTVANRPLSDDEIRTLIEKRFVGPLNGFHSKKGKEFSAGLMITDDMKLSFVFEGNDPDAIT